MRTQRIICSRVQKNLASELQEYYDSIVFKHESCIVVGINYPDPHINYRGKFINVDPFKLNVRAKYKYFIDVDENTLLKQYILRELKEYMRYVNDDIEGAKQDKFIIDPPQIIADNKWWIATYKKQKYVFMKFDQIQSTLLNIYAV